MNPRAPPEGTPGSLLLPPGISTNKIEVVADNQVRVKFRIEGDCPLGLHDLRLRTATGVSELRTFSVGTLREATEAEPNDEFLRPQKVMSVGRQRRGPDRGRRLLRLRGQEGGADHRRGRGGRLGIALFDPYVAIMDAKRFELASSDDAALIWQDAFASVVAPEDGTYLSRSAKALCRDGRRLYRVHIGDFPRPTATVPAGGKFGETVNVRLIGDVMGEKIVQVALPAEQKRKFGIVAFDEKGTAPYPNPFRLSPFGNLIEAEPNDDHETANRFEARWPSTA